MLNKAQSKKLYKVQTIYEYRSEKSERCRYDKVHIDADINISIL